MVGLTGDTIRGVPVPGPLLLLLTERAAHRLLTLHLRKVVGFGPECLEEALWVTCWATVATTALAISITRLRVSALVEDLAEAAQHLRVIEIAEV